MTDIENVVLSQENGAPVLVKDVAQVQVGYVPRLGQAGRDSDDDAVLAILVMNRTLHTNEVLARVKAEVAKINNDGTLPAGCEDRALLRSLHRWSMSPRTRYCTT